MNVLEARAVDLDGASEYTRMIDLIDNPRPRHQSGTPPQRHRSGQVAGKMGANAAPVDEIGDGFTKNG
jgi:hypothetical protein